jgi:hypothetical protein
MSASAASASASAAADLDADHPLAAANRAPTAETAIDAVCEAVVVRLSQRLPARVAIAHFPNKPGEYDFEGQDAAALVIYDGSRFDVAGQVGDQGVRETVRLTIVLLVRALRGATGAYGLTREIRTALHGQSLAGGVGLRPIEIELESEDEGVFRYRLVFETRLPAVPYRTATQSPLIHRTRAETD